MTAALFALALVVAAVPPKARQAMTQGQFDKALKLLDAEVGKGGDDASLAELQLQRAACLLALRQLDKTDAALVLALQKKADAAFDAKQANPELVERLEQAKKRVPAVLGLSTDVPAAARIDGKEWGPTPLTLELTVGTHRVDVTTSDGRTAGKEVVLSYGKKNELMIALPPKPQPVAVEEPKVEPKPAEPKVEPKAEPKLEPKLVVAPHPDPLPSGGEGGRALPVALLVVGGVVAAGGGGAFGWAQSRRVAVESGMTTRQEASTVVAVNAVGIAGMAVGGALLVTGAVVLAASGGSSATVALAPQPGGLGAALCGTW